MDGADGVKNRLLRTGGTLVVACILGILACISLSAKQQSKSFEEYYSSLKQRAEALQGRELDSLSFQEKETLDRLTIVESWAQRHPEHLLVDMDAMTFRQRADLLAEEANRYSETIVAPGTALTAVGLYSKCGDQERATATSRAGIQAAERLVGTHPHARWRVLPAFDLLLLTEELQAPTADDVRKAKKYCDLALECPAEDRDWITITRLCAPMARLYLRVGQPAKAETYARRAVTEAVPRDAWFAPPAQLTLAKALAAQGKDAEAKEVLQQLLKRTEREQYAKVHKEAQEELNRLTGETAE